MEFQAILGIYQLKNVDEIIKQRNDNIKYLNEGLEDFSGILKLLTYSLDIIYLAYLLLIEKPEKISRKKLRTELEKEGIETRPSFGFIPTQQPEYSNFKEEYRNKLTNSDSLVEIDFKLDFINI